MRRKTWLAWLALLGLAPGWALAEETTAPGSGSAASKGAIRSDDSASEWTSLSDLGEAKPATSSSSAGLARLTTSSAAYKTANSTSSLGLTSLGAAAGSATACGGCYGMGCSACSGACDPCGMGGLRRWSDPGMWGMWVDVDYLFWRLSGNDVPPLVTTAPAGVLPTLANPGTSIAFGNGELDDDFRSGGRIRFGGWIEDTHSVGWQGHFFTLADERNRFTFAEFAQPGVELPSLGVPFFAVGPDVESAVVIAFDNTPGAGFANEGFVNVTTSSDVYSAGAVMRHFLYEDRGMRVDALAGYRFFRLDEGLVLSASTTIGPNNPNPALPVGTVISFQDLFDVENEFHGGELGLVMERDFGSLLSVEVLSKIALGTVEQRAELEGASSTELAGFGTVATPGGLFVQPTNTGSPMARAKFERDEFAFLPEVNIKVGLQLTQQTRLTAGWTVIYMDNVLRSGDQIDRGVNPTQIGGGALVGPERPAFTFNDDDMWLYGASFGIESTY